MKNSTKLTLIVLAMLFIAASLPAQTVLIAKEDTSYKKALVNTLVEKLESVGLSVDIMDHKDDGLTGVDPGDWDVVYVLNSGAQAMVRPWVVDWLAEIRGNDSNVVVHTTKRTVWDEALDVDALSSASKKSNIDEVTDDIVSRIEAKL